MNKGQRVVSICALVLAIVAGIFPPWKFAINARVGNEAAIAQVPAGYAFIAAPPTLAHGASPYWGISIDFERLVWQYFLLMIVAAGSVFVLREISFHRTQPPGEIAKKFKAATSPAFRYAFYSMLVAAAAFTTMFLYLQRSSNELSAAVIASKTAHEMLYSNQGFDPEFTGTNTYDPVTVYQLPDSYVVHVEASWYRVEGSEVTVLDRSDPDVRHCCDGDRRWRSYAIATNGDWRKVPPP